jgi:ribonuclease HI
MEVDVYTDGSKNEPDIDHPERRNAAWAAVLHDDYFEKNWREMHEDNGRVHRTKTATKIQSWSGTLTQISDSSYLPELEALTRIAMILPASWKVTIWTDSESAIKAIENYDPQKPPHKRAQKAGWKLVETLVHTNKRRTHPVQLIHISSHEQELNPRSVGNATADLIAKAARDHAENIAKTKHRHLLSKLQLGTQRPNTG